MDLENQKRVLNISEEHGPENVVVLLGAAEVKTETDPAVYEEQVGMMEMVMDVPAIHEEMEGIRKEYCKY